MIQRIQSLYLFLTTILAVLFLSGTILEFSSPAGPSIMTAFKIDESVPGSGLYIIMTILLFAVPLLSLAIIFMYKNRKNQLRLTSLLILLIILLIVCTAFFAYSIVQSRDAVLLSWYKAILPLLMLIAALLAYRGIKKDENLVRSYDRLR